MPSVAGTVGALSRMLTGMVTMGAYRAVLGCAKPTASVATEAPPRTQVAVDIKPLQQLDSIVHVVSLSDGGKWGAGQGNCMWLAADLHGQVMVYSEPLQRLDSSMQHHNLMHGAGELEAELLTAAAGPNHGHGSGGTLIVHWAGCSVMWAGDHWQRTPAAAELHWACGVSTGVGLAAAC